MVLWSSKPVKTVRRSASSLATGSTPGSPRQTGQTLVLGGAPNSLAQPHHILDLVFSCTCVSNPMTASYSIRSGKGARRRSAATTFLSRPERSLHRTRENSGRGRSATFRSHHCPHAVGVLIADGLRWDNSLEMRTRSDQ